MESNTSKRNIGGRKPQQNRAIYRYIFRLNEDENSRFNTLFIQSGMHEKTAFIKNMLFSNVMKTVKIDKAAMDYYIRLTNFYAQFQAIGNNYNQTVKAIKTNFSEKRALVLLGKLERTTVQLIVLNKKIIELTHEFEQKHLNL